MVKKIHEISDLIPSNSTRVKKYFNYLISDKTSSAARYPIALIAVLFSAVNSISYALVIPFQCVTLPYHRNFSQVKNTASSSWNSLQFIAAITAYILATWIKPNQYSLKPFPIKTDFEPIVHQALWQAPKDWAGVGGKTFEQREFEGFTIFSDLLLIGPDKGGLKIQSLNELYELLDGGHFVLVNTAENTGYLFEKDDPIFKDGVRNNIFSKIKTSIQIQEKPIKQDILQDDLNGFSLVGSILKLTSSPKNAISTQDKDWVMVSSMVIHSQTQEQSKPQPSFFTKVSTTLEQLQTTFKNYILKSNETYNMKYRYVQEHFQKLLNTDGCKELYAKASHDTFGGTATDSCKDLYNHIMDTTSFDPLKWYQQFVIKLRAAAKFVGKTITGPDIQFILLLAFERFAGISLYGYCLSLVEIISGKFDGLLKLEIFWDEYQRRNDAVKKLPQQVLSLFYELQRKMKGVLNAGFDPLKSENTPYIYGTLQIKDGKNVTILRHGTPIAQTGIPEITPDYKAFVEAAKRAGKNILHVILENSDPKKLFVGDESLRVNARLKLQEKTNFFPIALRMDGEFFTPKNYMPCTIEDFHTQFSEQLFGELKTTGFLLPETVRKVLTKENFTECMNGIHATYFKDQSHLNTLEDYQAYILLTYSEMVLSLCSALDISILEALCKDDKDRGGVFKAVLTLHSLYKNNAITSESLQEVMVNLIAAPFMINQKTILDDRGILIHHVLEVMKRSYKEGLNIKGETPFHIVPTPYQSVFPMGNMCISKDEYDQFLSYVKNGDIVLQSPPRHMTNYDIFSLPQSLFSNTSLNYKVEHVADGALPIYRVIDDKKNTITYVTASIVINEDSSKTLTLSITPNGSTCKTIEEYTAFLDSAKNNIYIQGFPYSSSDLSTDALQNIYELFFQNPSLGYNVQKFSSKERSTFLINGPNEQTIVPGFELVEKNTIKLSVIVN